MKIENIKVMRGPNYWSNYRKKLIVMKLDIEELEDYPTNKIAGFKEREDGEPICAENLTVHLLILTKGNGFLLKERKFIPSKNDMDLEMNIRSH